MLVPGCRRPRPGIDQLVQVRIKDAAVGCGWLLEKGRIEILPIAAVPMVEDGNRFNEVGRVCL